MGSRKFRTAAIGGAAVLGLVLSACGGGTDDGDGGGGGEGVDAAFDAGTTGIVNKSDKKGGTLKFVMSDDFDSTDPGDTYYAFGNNFLRNYARPLMTYKSVPGTEGNKATPDLAEAPGVPSDGNRTWTFKLKKGLKYEDGSEIVAEDVKYAVLRTFDRGVLRNGPAYFPQFLLDGDKFKGPYKDKNWKAYKGIETPDKSTVIFKLTDPFPEFNELVMFSGQTAPVPAAKDKGANYRLHPLSSGPYKFEGNYKPGKGGTLVRNTEWDAKTDPNRKALPDKITIQAGVDANEVDNLLLSGDAHVDMAGSGVQDNARKTILTDEAQKVNADNPVAGFHWYIPISKVNIPNIDCRKAIIYAADRDAMWRAYGGDVGGERSTNLSPPIIPGREEIQEIYPWDPDSPKKDELDNGYKGDVAKAKESLKKCGKPDGFKTTMTYRSDRPKEKKTAEAVQQGLKRAGIELELKGYPAGTYTNDQLGSPSFVKKEKIGFGTYGWAADWPTGFGYMQPLTDGKAIIPAGNTNVSELNLPEVNKLWSDVVKVEDPAERDKIYNQIDRAVMEDAAILPNVYAKSLLYRPETLTNAYFHAGFGMYDYANLGVSE